MTSLWFVVPAHGRTELAAICLEQLARTCDGLADDGLEASAVVIADRPNLVALRKRVGELVGIPATGARGRFAAVERENSFLSLRFNDGIQLATDPAYNPAPADFVVPCGSDDWIDHRILRRLPGRREIVTFRQLSFVRPDGREISSSRVRYEGGCGIRIYPRELLARCAYRPAEEDRRRGCDTSILLNVRKETPSARIVYADAHDRQIVDWKTEGANLNDYAAVGVWSTGVAADPFVELADTYPAEALEQMRGYYGR